MKSLSILRLVVVFLLALCSSATFASDFVTVDGFKFLVDTNKDEATLLANDYSGEVVVPASVTFEGKDYPVTTLGTECFGSSVTKVAIPNSVTTLGDKCFYKSGVKTIDIPNSVTSLGESCFESSSLEKIDLPESVVELGESCFSLCGSLQDVILPNSLTYIPNSCFVGCDKIKKIKVPSSVKTLSRAFSSCSNLEEVDLPEGLENISGYGCFSGCTQLKTITFPSTLKFIDGEMFDGCSNLKTIICKATTPPDYGRRSPFEGFSKSECALYVPQASLETYKKKWIWKDFGIYKAIEGENEPVTACSTPVISYENGQLIFESSTSGAEYHYTIKDADVVTDKYNTDGNVQLEGKLDISVYATADGYMASEKAAATLYWLNAEGGDDTNNINLVKTRGVMVTTDSDITISGLNDGEVVTFYSVNGVNLGSAKVVQGVLHFAKPNESIVIAKIKGNDLKIAIK